jgi:hypothetical protein
MRIKGLEILSFYQHVIPTGFGKCGHACVVATILPTSVHNGTGGHAIFYQLKTDMEN